MAGLPDASSPELKITQAFGSRAPYWPVFREKRIDAYARSTGAMSQPGRVVSAHERRRRKAASISSMDGLADQMPEDDHGSFIWLGRKIQTEARHWKRHCLARLDRDIVQDYGPEACLGFVPEIRGGRNPLSARSFICLLLAFLLVFGASYTLMEHLLFATRASAACTPTTIYMPVTYTTTVTYTPSPSDASAAGVSSATTTSTIYSTVYSTSAVTKTVSLLSAATPGAGPSTSYIATVTTTQLVSPVSTMPFTAVTSSVAILETFTPPAYTSTTFSFVSPAITVTSTSTHYSTVQISYATPSSSSYAGMGPSGWNNSSTVVASPATSAVSGTAVVETLTATYYMGTGNATTSTATTLLTTTITVYGTSTVTLISASYPLTSTSSSSSLAAAGTGAITASAPSTTSSAMASSSTAASSADSISSALVSAGMTSSASGLPVVYPNVTSMSTTYALSSDAETAVLPTSSSMTFPSSSGAAANSSIVNGLTTSGSSTSTSSTSVSNTTFPTSITAAVIIPVTSTLPSGSLTTMLETTSTTIGLLGTGTQTVSGYFVWNGTTTVPFAPSSATGSPLSSVTTQPGPAFVTSGSGSSTSSSNMMAPYGTMTYAPSSAPMSTGTAPSLTIPVNGSSAALSVLSSVLSGLTESSPTASLFTSDATPMFTSSSSPSPAASSSTSVLPISTSSSATTSIQITSSTSTSLPTATSISSTLMTMVSSSQVLPTSSSDTAGAATLSSASNSSMAAPLTQSTSSLQGYSTIPSLSSTITSAGSSNPFPASSATATPTACGEHGNFTMTFDDLPNFVPNKQNKTDITQAPPIPNPYHHLTFSNGYVYGPQPSVPYLPSSAPHLAVFLANGSGMTASSMQPGEVGDGPYESMSAFWFDAFIFTGYTWSPDAKNEIATYTQNATLAPCPSSANCQLQHVSFPTSFRGLSGVRMQAFVGNEPRMFFMDDMKLGWSNNTCQAGLTRLRYQ
ncbi:hypothetical protein LTR02_003752 [Friedmanniomyces endolithicus]|nr:hypothetical protein LTR94_012840 [Friedmanniomyces endolithicus]KAK0782137.1 hypothetical protein LTR59_012239 [Friedmanniomyces endolithicus]KAK0818531.1 hypothetical protein LTR38_001113 [Friedmanniomyces endolithicus]KAK0841384.1 hypothetical protein LTR03_009917 [Friedmanniomyces endolithicus]KAK0910617.1 hypothetical protein LTR02_003752 [Friedmanniomyces endolithicus]